jgi:hypothetical protein
MMVKYRYKEISGRERAYEIPAVKTDHDPGG